MTTTKLRTEYSRRRLLSPPLLAQLVFAVSLLCPSFHAEGLGSRVLMPGQPQNAPAAQTPSTAAEQHLDEARAAIKAKDYSRAKKELKLAQSMNKEMPEPYLLLGWLARLDGRQVEAKKDFSKAIDYRPGYGEAHYWLAVVYFETGDRARSTQELETALKLSPQLSAAYALKGKMELISNHSRAALEAYQDALKYAQPDDEGLPMVREVIQALTAYLEFNSHKGEPGYKPAMALNAPRPNYTPEARAHHVQGTVKLAMLIDERGKAQSILVISALGYGLDEEAKSAARQIKFTAATKDGSPVAYWQTVDVDFKLR
jgi:TonB family protein